MRSGQALFGEVSRKDAIARREAHLQGLGHGAEVGDQARRHRRRDAQGVRRSLRVQPPQAGAGRSAGHRTEHRGRMPAFAVVLVRVAP